jgi:hypothetical protein
MVKDEERDLPECLAYQAAVGFDTIIAYENLSIDATPKILARAARWMDVRAVPWNRQGKGTQTGAYQHCLDNFGREFDWIAFIDSDEFLVPHTHPSVREFLNSHDANAMVVVNWAMFGSCGHVDFPSGLIIESFTRRAHSAFGPNGHVKSIARPEQVCGVVNAHLLDVRGGPVVLPDGRPVVEWYVPGVTIASADHAVCQLNHYFVRSRAHWAAKMRRGYLSSGTTRSEKDFIYNDRNDVRDATAVRFAPQVRATMQKMALCTENGSTQVWCDT